MKINITASLMSKLNNNEKYPQRLIRHMKHYLIINNQNDK